MPSQLLQELWPTSTNYEYATQMPFFLLLFLLARGSDAQVLVIDDAPYYTLLKENIRYTYPTEARSYLGAIDSYTRYFIEKYQASFAWPLDEGIKLSIASTQNQVANGFATVTPFMMTTHYQSGVGLLETFAEESFMLALASHETAHLFQLSAKAPPSSWVKKHLGNTPVLLTPVLPFFTFPNAYLPTSFVEGNAVLNESTHGLGGRLYSGEVRAEVMAQMKANDSGPSRFINTQLEFPLSQSYHQGGYFFSFLAQKFGLDKTNRFFLTHAQSIFWPFSVNAAFRAHFGASYNQLIHQFRESLESDAQKFTATEGTELCRVFTRPRLNSDGNSIFFVGNPNGRLSNRLYIYAQKTESMKSESTDLPSGKTFFVNGKYVSNSSQQINYNHISYGLFSEGLEILPETEGEIVSDLKGDQRLGLSATESYLHPSLLKNGKPFAQSASMALLDDQGQSYYFVQEGQERVLYRDSKELVRFKGFFGIVADVSRSEEVLFIANSPYGSSLFSAKNGKIYRRLNSDDVIDAKFADSNQVLVASISDKSYKIVKASLIDRLESPAEYKYSFAAQNPLNLQPLPMNSDEREVSTVSNLRFSQANLIWAGTTTAQLVFTDPFLWNYLVLDQRLSKSGYDAGLTYLNTRHRLGWLLSAQYDGSSNYKNSGFLAASDYTLYKSTRHQGHIRFGPYHLDEWPLGSPWARRTGVMSQLLFSYSRVDHPLAFEPYRHWLFSALHKNEWLDVNGSHFAETNSVRGEWGGDIRRQTFLNLSASWAWSNQNTVAIGYLRTPALSNLSLPELVIDGQASEVRQWRAKISQVLDQSVYPTRFPLGLMRFAPFLLVQDTTVKRLGRQIYPSWRNELMLGSDFDFLLLNQFVARSSVGFGSVYSNWGRQSEWQVEMSLGRSF